MNGRVPSNRRRRSGYVSWLLAICLVREDREAMTGNLEEPGTGGSAGWRGRWSD